MAGDVSFNRDIRPILSDSCWHCHGPGTQEAELRLDLRQHATAETLSGAIPLVPGDAAASEMIRRVMSTDEAEQMPPPDSHKTLTAQQKDLLRRWVEQGAPYEAHWAYAPLTRPAPPAIAGHPVDSFILAQLQANGLSLSPEADKRTLVRRASLDLRGLPPTPEELQAFLDDSSPDAYERAVDRFLESREFAEKQTLHWLDAVRFADTRGYHGDEPAPASPYRDYVLRAFHQNMPFDQFTREQLAGDLLPNPSDWQRIASGFNRLNRTSVEGGIQEKEYLAKYGADRVRTVSAVWLGQTVGCAECHDHKFDPITHKDFYSLKAFFADLKHASARGGEFQRIPPEARERIEELAARLDAARKALDQRLEQLADSGDEGTAWEQEALARSDDGQLAWSVPPVESATATDGVKLEVFNDEPVESELYFDGSNYLRAWPGNGLVIAGGANPDAAVYEVAVKPGGGAWAQIGVEVFFHDPLPGNSLGRGNQTFLLSELEVLLAEGDAPPRPVKIAAAIDDGKGGRPARLGPAAAIDGDSNTAWGFPHYVGNMGNRFLAVQLAEPIVTSADARLIIRLRHETPQRKATIGRFRILLSQDVRSLPAPTPLPWMVGPKVESIDAGQAPPRSVAGLPPVLGEALRTPRGDRTPPQAGQVRQWLKATHPKLRSLLAEEALAEIAFDQASSEHPACLVSEPTAEPTVTRVLPRGNWMDDSGDIVEPAIPGFLGTLNTDVRATRLDLANWLGSNDNPLTARVVANRVWRQFFGAGLSRVLDDLGSQGQWPTHPELLDWLACEFREPSFRADGAHAWDYKHLVRVIVTSDAYRQSSSVSQELAELDPGNRLLARQSRPRLDAEVIRDQALAVGGLLKSKWGGPSVFPYQPEGYLATLYYPRRGYPLSRGDDLWRRSLYTFWQRSFPLPTLLTFDGCTREETQVDRASSNTPLQALVLWNDPTFVEAARGLAVQALAEPDVPTETRIASAFERALARPPHQDEVRALTELHDRQLHEFREHPDSAAAYNSIGEWSPHGTMDEPSLAAMSVVARTIMNLHEFITRN